MITATPISATQTSYNFSLVVNIVSHWSGYIDTANPACYVNKLLPSRNTAYHLTQPISSLIFRNIIHIKLFRSEALKQNKAFRNIDTTVTNE